MLGTQSQNLASMAAGHRPVPPDELVKDPASGHWTGYFPGVVDGTKWGFFVTGRGGVQA
ncbi:hypothetical protein [Rhodococcus sp. IEGM 1307]|jgi:1,4-alpha-glucan branching enzyme|uniref:hypothetical protein n=1 Tax=Rhodococcus sp. IEGM 1307 TaxID=3047091 RepID=UPI0024B83454|nr:hypothetical protein [Rhodococcus sp. IEGM 1307]MDI9978772.1 hypothetical protein [Rhodococcus sp. IEGM 1307]